MKKRRSDRRHRGDTIPPEEALGLGTIFRQSMFWTPDRQGPSAWTQHVPFAFWLVDVLRPGTIVELGTQNGVSYFAMCQAVKALNLPTRCFAVDTWKGDAHAGFYGEETYHDLSNFHDAHYCAFSRLIRCSFDDALPHFEEHSIDLLHIDGLHTYEAVRHDLHSWLPKLAENAVVLFHDINVRERDFGVSQFWNEISVERPHFVFLHGHGLGILGCGCKYPNPLRYLFGASDKGDRASSIRAVFAYLGQSIELSNHLVGAQRQVTEREQQITVLKRASIDWEGRVATLNEKLLERNREIGALGALLTERTTVLAEREGQIVELERAILERDSNNSGLKLKILEHNNQITDLKQGVVERDKVICDLKQGVVERDKVICDLKQGVVERETIISDLGRAAFERDNKVSNLENSFRDIEQRLKETLHRLEEILKSRSWRIMTPYRVVGGFVWRTIGAAKRSQVMTRVVIASLLLPSALVYYQGLRGAIGAVLRRQDFFSTIIANPTVIRDRLLHRASWYRRSILASLSLAIRINRSGSISRSIHNFILVMRREGRDGLHRRLITTIPNLASGPTSVTVIADALAPDVARRILVADYRIPRADVSAGERATVGILKDLCALGYEVVFLPNDMAPSAREQAELKAFGVKVVTREGGYQYAAHYVAAQGHQFGAFYIIRVDVAEAILPAARQVAPTARVIFHSPDLYSLREMREAEFDHDEGALKRARATRDREIAVMSRADQVVLVSPAEVPFIQSEMPGASITVFPALYASVKPDPRGFAERRNVFFLGGFGHPPNISAVHWFVSEVWPHVRAGLPEIEFHIIGSEAPDSVVNLRPLARRQSGRFRP